MDCDAISVIISFPARTLTNEKKQAIEDFFHVFGSDLSGCSLPHSAIGSTKASGLFGCGGNMCQHLPECLQGQEMLVLNTPVKVGLHMSCKKNMNSELNSKGYYLSLSNGNNVCFDAQAAYNTPPFGIMVEAIINSCCIEGNGNHVIHVADVGSRYPITTEPSQISRLFQAMQAMTAKGISVELAQCDIAFVSPIPNGQLVQMSLDRGQHQSCQSQSPLLDGLSSTVYPLHNLPDFQGQKLSARDLKGTILLSKPDSRWRDGRNIVIASHNEQDDDAFPHDFSSNVNVTDLFASSDADAGPQVLSTSSSSLFSVKLYSLLHTLCYKKGNATLSVSNQCTG